MLIRLLLPISSYIIISWRLHQMIMAHSPPQKLWYLPNHRDALQAHMHLLHKLGNAKSEANYHAYYQSLIKDGTAMEPLAMLT